MEAYLAQVADYLLAQSWQIAVLTAAVAAITFLLRNRSAHVRYLLWLIVLAKCLLPPLYTVPLHVWPQETLSAWVARPWPSRPAEVTGESDRLPRPAATVSKVTAPAQEAPSTPSTEASPTDSALDILPALWEESAVAQIQVEREPQRLTWAAIRYYVGVAWLAGACGYLLLNILRAWRTGLWLRPFATALQAELASHFSQHGFPRLPPIWLVDGIGQPFVWGLLRGSIYVPADLVSADSNQECGSVLGHELGHVRRFDAAVNLLQVLAQTIYWFHPFVWWANRKIRYEREKCCDEMAVAGLNTPPKDYSMALIRTLVADHELIRRVPSLAVVGPARNLEERIRTVCEPGRRFYRRPSLVAASVALLIALVTVPAALVLKARAETKGQETSKETAKEKTDQEKDALIGPVQVVREERAANAASPLFEDGFENISVGTYPSGNGWTQLFSGKEAYVSSASAHTGTKSFRLDSDPSWARMDYVNLNEVPDRLTYEVSIRVDPRYGSIALAGFMKDMHAEGPVWDYFSVSGVTGTVDFVGLEGTHVGQYTLGTWCTVRADLDFVNLKGDLWMNGSLLVKDVAIRPKEFDTDRYGHVVLNQWGVMSCNYSDGPSNVVYFDDIRLDKTPYVVKKALPVPGEAKPARTVEIVTSTGTANLPGSVIIWKHDGNGGYQPVFEQEGLYGLPSVAVGDVDGDGVDDVVGTSRGGSYFITCKDGVFVSTKLDKYSQQTRAAAIGDIDGDRSNEIAIVENWENLLPTRVHTYRLKEGGRFEKSTWNSSHDLVWDAKIVDIDGDGAEELVMGSEGSGITVSREIDGKMQIVDVLVDKGLPEGGRYIVRKRCNGICGYEGDLTPVVESGLDVAQSLAFGDMLGGGSRCMGVMGGGVFQVIRHEKDGYTSVFAKRSGFEARRKYPAGLAIGDALNDGRNVLVVGSDKLMVFRYDGQDLARVWKGENMRPAADPQPSVRNICIADCDGNGRKEIIFQTVPEAGKDDAGNLLFSSTFAVMKNTGKGSLDFYGAWESQRLNGDIMRIAVADIDGR